ncbi:phage major capsid protein, HK97 family [Frankineae bacterium MT45]|nr:phage major capsid protein, HK97 family [Frankineae bacterium MT45]
MPSKLMEAKDQVRSLSKKALEVTEDSTLTAMEQKSALDKLEPEIKQWTDEVQALQHIENRRKEFQAATGQDVEQAAAEANQNEAKSIGEQFVQSAGYKGLINRGLKGGQWSSGDVELKTTLTEGTAGSQGPGYAPVTAVPDLQPGVVDIRFRQLLIEDLFPGGTTESALIRYLVETAVTNAAAAVAEGNLKPESALKFDKVDEVLHKIATFLPISDEMLEDWSQAQSYVNARLILFVKQAAEAQILNGDGTGANMVGLLNRAGLATSIAKGTSPSTGTDNSMDAIYRQITQIRTTAFLEPDAVVIEPVAWENILLSKNSQGAYYANGPFASDQPATLWGKRTAVTAAMASSTALVGSFQQGGQIFRKGGLTVEASNSHADFFQRNLTAIRAERRLALAVYRPGAFGTVTGL